MQDATVVVTGGTRGVGRGISQAFLDCGARVVVNGRDAAVGEACVSQLGIDGRLSFYPGDVTASSIVDGLIDFAVESFGRLDVLVLNAGGNHVEAPIVELEDDEWRRIVDTNLSHVVWGMRRALQHMIPRRSGRIIVTSAAEGKLPRAGASAYVAAKHGVNGLVKSVAHEVGPLGITVNAILPGPLETGAGGGHESPLVSLSKIGRATTIGEVAAVAVMLASPAMTSVTGCLFPVDGGMTPY